jgi:hypothetical protein
MASETIAHKRGQVRTLTARPHRRHVYPILCPRCGEDCSDQRGRRFNEDDYLEVFHERMDYEELVRLYARLHKDADKALFLAETDAALWRHQALLYRAQLVIAGLEPTDVLETDERPVTEDCPF